MKETGYLQLTKDHFYNFNKFLDDSMENIVDEVSIKIWANFKSKAAEICRRWQQSNNQPETINEFFGLMRRAREFFEVRKAIN